MKIDQIKKGRKQSGEKESMIRLSRATLVIAGAGLLLLLVACGQNFSGTGSSSSSQPGLTGTPGTAQVVKTGIVSTRVPLHPSPTPTAPAQLSGKVTVQIDTVPKGASDSLVFTIDNQTNQQILFADHLSECTVLLLQVQSPPNSGLWQTVAPCKLMTVTRLHTLPSGQTLTVTLKAPGNQWAAGIYRAVLTYSITGANQKLQTVFSPTFQVG